MRPGVRRALAILTVALPLAAGLAYAFRPQPVPVDLATVGRGAMIVTVDDEGWTRVRDLFVVSTPVAGRILRVAVHAGDPVTEGDTAVATILPSDPAFLDLRSRAQAEAALEAANAALALADAEVAKARAELDFANADMERARTLAQSKTVSPRALDLALLEVRTREAALSTAEADRRVRQHQRANARAALIDPSDTAAAIAAAGNDMTCCLTVRAPARGRILRVVTQSEGVVAAGTPIAEIGDVRDMEILVQLLSTEAVRISEGAPVRVEQWGGGTVLAGRVRRIEPYGFTKVSALGIEEQRVNVLIDFTDPPERWAALGHGYRVEVRIVVWQGNDVLKAPMGALFRDGGQWAVFVEAQGRAALRRVTLGWSNDTEAEIRSGLEPGERIILHPSDRVADGVRVTGRAGL